MARVQVIPIPSGVCSPADRMAGLCPDSLRNWFTVENAAGSGSDAPVDIMIDGPIVDPFMAEMLGIGVSSNQVVDQILALRGQPLNVWINSEGGLITAGLAIYNQLLMHDAPVTTIVYGFAMSIASVIAMAGDTVIMAPASAFFIHEGRNELDGTASDHRQMAQLLDQMSEQIAAVYTARGDSRVNWRGLMQAGTGPTQGTLITAEDAVKRHLADRIDTKMLRQPSNIIDLGAYNAANQTIEAAEDATCDCATCDMGGGCDCPDCPQMDTAMNKQPTKREVEHAIRAFGMSDRRAKAIISAVWAEVEARDVPDEPGETDQEPDVAAGMADTEMGELYARFQALSTIYRVPEPVTV